MMGNTILNKCGRGINRDIYVASLAPNIPEDIKEYKIYESYLKRAFKDTTIKNIAITGNFGVGKSSFLKWFSRKKKFLFVSLGSFINQEINNLECNLVQQILIGCKSTVLKKFVWKSVIYIIALVLSLNIIYYLFIIYGRKHLTVVNGYLFSADFNKIIEKIGGDLNMISGIILIALIPVLILLVISRVSLKKLSFKMADFETEFEFNKEQNVSFINLYRMELVDILHRFAKRFDYTIIFEDMDRLKRDNCISLFTELKEINRLINLSPTKFQAEKKTVRFIYVIHDAIFNGEGNTACVEDSCIPRVDQLEHLKFFDYIMPIIPRMLSDAASNYIKYCFEKVHFHYITEFINIVGKEIDDYRIVQNVVNEYCTIKDIYEERFDVTVNEEDEKHIAALAVYKTLMPQDYQQIRVGKSLLQIHKPKIEYDCIRDLMEYRWLCIDCLRYVGLSERAIEKYIESLLVPENLKENSNAILSVIQDKYALFRNVILDKDFLPNEEIVKQFGYSLLNFELSDPWNDLSVLKKLCRDLSLSEIRINETYTDSVSETLVSYFQYESINIGEKNVLNVCVVLEYLLSFCDCDFKFLLDCYGISDSLIMKCYLKLSEIHKNVMISNGFMEQWFKKLEKRPSDLRKILQLVDYIEADRLLRMDKLSPSLESELRSISGFE